MIKQRVLYKHSYHVKNGYILAYIGLALTTNPNEVIECVDLPPKLPLLLIGGSETHP